MDKLTPFGQVNPREVLVPVFGTWGGALSAIRSHVTTQSASVSFPEAGAVGLLMSPACLTEGSSPHLLVSTGKKPRKGDSLVPGYTNPREKNQQRRRKSTLYLQFFHFTHNFPYKHKN